MKFWSFVRWLMPLVLVLAGALRAAEPTDTPRPATPAAPDYLEQVVDQSLAAFDLRPSGNSFAHHAISLVLLLIALLARRIVTRLFFPALRRLAARTETTLDDKMFPALEGPAAALVVIFGLFSALRVLKLPAAADHYLGAGSQVAFSLVVFWGLWRAFAALLDHLDEVARERSLGVAAFMPWIRKTLLTGFVVVAALLTFQSLGFDVKAVLAGLGIGGPGHPGEHLRRHRGGRRPALHRRRDGADRGQRGRDRGHRPALHADPPLGQVADGHPE
jgi:MscS family membrane protein